MKSLTAAVLLGLFMQSIAGHRILCLFPFNGRSHFRMFEALCKGLARRGHRIDMISHFPAEESIVNYTDIVDLSGTWKTVVNSVSVEDGKALQRAITYYIATEFGGDLCEIMARGRMRRFIRNPPKDPPYDLVITEYLGSPCFLGIGALLNVPVVVASSYMDVSHVASFMGNPMSYAFFSHNEKAVINTFWDRLRNAVADFIQRRRFSYYTSDQTEIMRKYLREDLPDVRELESRVSLALIYGHHSFHGIRPITPAVVEVGGLHVEFDRSELTPELKDWMDSANDGVIYFTLGSLMMVETLPERTILDLYASFAKISPVKVLMRCADARKLPLGLPDNVATASWIPQIAVLRHKNVKVFITHGGLMGTTEAIFYGVPMIGIPVFADQEKIVNILVHKNVAIRVDVDDITESSMDHALDALLHDSKYLESAKRASKLFRDRPMTAMDTAGFWIEYVMRNGADSLRSPAANLSSWQLNLIDVFGFLIICLLLAIYLSATLVNVLSKEFLKRRRASRKKKRE